MHVRRLRKRNSFVLVFLFLAATSIGYSQEGTTDLVDTLGDPKIAFALVPTIKGKNFSTQECEIYFGTLNRALEEEFNKIGFKSTKVLPIERIIRNTCSQNYSTQDKIVMQENIFRYAKESNMDFVFYGAAEISVTESRGRHIGHINIDGGLYDVQTDAQVAVRDGGNFRSRNLDRMLSSAFAAMARKLATCGAIDNVKRDWRDRANRGSEYVINICHNNRVFLSKVLAALSKYGEITHTHSIDANMIEIQYRSKKIKRSDFGSEGVMLQVKFGFPVDCARSASAIVIAPLTEPRNECICTALGGCGGGKSDIK